MDNVDMAQHMEDFKKTGKILTNTQNDIFHFSMCLDSDACIWKGECKENHGK
jgi:hypothetical protein